MGYSNLTVAHLSMQVTALIVMNSRFFTLLIIVVYSVKHFSTYVAIDELKCEYNR